MNLRTHMEYLVAFAILLGFLVVPAAKAGDSYQSVDDAARAGLAAAETLTADYEAGSTIYLCGTAYAFMPVTTDGKRDRIAVTVYSSSECVLAGMFHTHPKGDARFSTADVKAACALKVPSYIKPRNGSIRLFDCATLSYTAAKAALTRPITGTEIYSQ